MFPSNYKIIYKEVKHLRIKVSEDNKVRVIAPLSYNKGKIYSIIKSRENWINNKLNYFTNRKISSETQPKFLILNENFIVKTNPELSRRFFVDINKKIIYLNSNISKSLFFKNLVIEFAREYLRERINQLSVKHKINYSRIFIRNSYTKWGNCSKQKNISLNWRLIYSPEYVIDYVILHELLHTRIMNHSKLFWLRLSALIPDIKKSTDWLSKNGYSLF